MKRAALLILCLAGCAPAPHIIGTAPAYDVRAVEWAMSPIRPWRDYKYPQDHFRKCADTLRLAFGDCDDYAQCAKEITAHWPGCETRFVFPNPRHVVTFIRCDGYGIFGYFDNGIYHRGLPVLDKE